MRKIIAFLIFFLHSTMLHYSTTHNMFIMYTLVKHKWAQNLETITMHYGPFGIQKFSNLRFLYWEDIGAEFLCYFCPTLHCLKIFYYLYECSKIKYFWPFLSKLPRVCTLWQIRQWIFTEDFCAWTISIFFTFFLHAIRFLLLLLFLLCSRFKNSHD